ncbi:staphylococcus nuclease domain [Halalkalibacter akibai JCM 9157]|uniref:Staphylococcus nuclease domain n=1 Tax=Halalkalibacter akibai (strain ATCC 43226 / DSM 21942 / CIP 109018 / JCM 9157 / 1139) TaxID=1236973 RepID=W4QV84_HALA3|nr:staphylococcus nuclease domain [Halalkalibacter akibai JCM 9157]
MKKLIVLNLFLLAVLFLVACTNDPSTDENKEDILIETSSAVETDEVEVDEQEHKEESPEESNGTFIQATVVRVVDGDTVIVKLPNNTEERVRLLLIDTPESVHPTKPVQPFGLEASEFAKELMYPGKTVELELDIIERDRYGRLLAYVWIGERC